MRRREFIRLFGGAAGLAACCTRSSQREAATDILGVYESALEAIQ